MKMPDPDIYFGQYLRIYSPDGDITEGTFDGYNYDYDDDGNEFVEFDIISKDGYLICFADNEVSKIEVLGGVDD